MQETPALLPVRLVDSTAVKYTAAAIQHLALPGQLKGKARALSCGVIDPGALCPPTFEA